MWLESVYPFLTMFFILIRTFIRWKNDDKFISSISKINMFLQSHNITPEISKQLHVSKTCIIRQYKEDKICFGFIIPIYTFTTRLTYY